MRLCLFQCKYFIGYGSTFFSSISFYILEPLLGLLQTISHNLLCCKVVFHKLYLH